MVSLLEFLRQSDLHLIRISFRPESILLSVFNSAVMLWENEIRIEGVDHDHRAVDVGVVLGRGEEEYIDVFEEQMIFQ